MEPSFNLHSEIGDDPLELKLRSLCLLRATRAREGSADGQQLREWHVFLVFLLQRIASSLHRCSLNWARNFPSALLPRTRQFSLQHRRGMRLSAHHRNPQLLLFSPVDIMLEARSMRVYLCYTCMYPSVQLQTLTTGIGEGDH